MWHCSATSDDEVTSCQRIIFLIYYIIFKKYYTKIYSQPWFAYDCSAVLGLLLCSAVESVAEAVEEAVNFFEYVCTIV
jgi:hypothetical protein